MAGSKLLAITDTACSKTVAGSRWLEEYLAEAKRIGDEPLFYNTKDSFKFGASKIFESGYSVLVTFELGKFCVQLLVAVVQSDVPLLLSRGALAKLGMVLNVAENRADFQALGLKEVRLISTDTGHPALPMQPIRNFRAGTDKVRRGLVEILIFPRGRQYTVFVAQRGGEDTKGPKVSVRDYEASWIRPVLFYPKKIPSGVKNMWLDEAFPVHSFLAWWSQTNISNDFWIEGEHTLVRVHLVPRRGFFRPEQWTTEDSEHKEALLNALGAVRRVFGISCKSHQALGPVHGPWRDSIHDSAYPTLWIGRSVFSRASMPCLDFCNSTGRHGRPCGVADGPHDHPAEDHLGDAQGGAAPRGSCQESAGQPEMEHG